VGRAKPLSEAIVDDALHSARRGRRIDAKAVGQALHRAVSAGQEVKCIHLALFERFVFAEVVITEGCSPCATTEFSPGFADAECVIPIDGVAEIDSFAEAGVAVRGPVERRCRHLAADISDASSPAT
jgi:hypothetical protein